MVRIEVNVNGQKVNCLDVMVLKELIYVFWRNGLMYDSELPAAYLGTEIPLDFLDVGSLGLNPCAAPAFF